MITKSLRFLTIILFIVSCKDAKNEKIQEINTKKEVTNIIVDSTKSTPKISEEVVISGDLFKTLLPTSYRIDKNDDPTKDLSKDWFDLFEKDGSYYLEKAAFTISKGYDECAGTDTKIIESKKNTLLLLDYKKLTTGKVDNLLVSKKHIWPKENVSFDFKNTTYTLRGVGDVKSTENRTNDKEENEIWNTVENYKLYIKTSDTNEQLILSEDSFSDTFVVLIFVGDIDRDGKLDFIFEANRNYEEKRVILFLSSEAEENKIIKKVSEISIQFDC